MAGAGGATGPAEVWASLDQAWRVAFAQAWDALRGGNIPVGACVTTASGRIVHAARNRVMDRQGPPGEIWGSSLGHAEINALARVGFRQHRDLVLTTTLEPCLQCAAAVRLSPVETVRYAGADSYWDGCHDFTKLSDREAARGQPGRDGPRPDELGLFATVISRVGPDLTPRYERWLRDAGEGPVVDLARELSAPDRLGALARLDVADAFSSLFPQLGELRQRLGGRPTPAGPDGAGAGSRLSG